mmetsp:Transcript_21030/g.49647  ORF Transcript_21030/g.49647 Transcript_21030/m.49647 type:complete len:225 (+) Transcript_21030:613-1287(+)
MLPLSSPGELPFFVLLLFFLFGFEGDDKVSNPVSDRIVIVLPPDPCHPWALLSSASSPVVAALMSPIVTRGNIGFLFPNTLSKTMYGSEKAWKFRARWRKASGPPKRRFTVASEKWISASSSADACEADREDESTKDRKPLVPSRDIAKFTLVEDFGWCRAAGPAAQTSMPTPKEVQLFRGRVSLLSPEFTPEYRFSSEVEVESELVVINPGMDSFSVAFRCCC